MKLRTRVLNPMHYVLWIAVMTGFSIASSENYYTAAVFEYAREGDEIQDNAAVVIKANLENYERATRAAAEQGADIILFPEYGLFHPINRSQTKSYLESIPDPNEVTVIPCNEPQMYHNRPVLYNLSCMAKSNQIVVVANMGGMEFCGNKTGCPEDGRLQLNANVAFDQNGTLIARYYKERLFYELMMDLPREKQNPIFRTSFGKFATFTSFDIMFKKMSLVAEIKDVDAILFSALWFNYAPFYSCTQFFQGWAIGNNATLIVANFHHPNYLVTGSGIFMGKKGSIGHVLSPDGISKLIVATIPKRSTKILKPANIFAVFKNGTQKWNDDGKSIPEVCSNSRNSTPSVDDYICMNEDTSNYTLVKLEKTADHLKACNNGMCCELDYVAKNLNESFYLGVFNGSHKPFTRYFYWEENCFLARCEDTDGKACSTFPLLSKTLFYKVHMTANFASRKIYPSLVGDRMKLISVKDWSFIRRLESSSIIMDNNAGIPLLAATLNGRAYEKDPPYGADIIVFPEYGIFPPVNRSLIRKFLELIPDPKIVTVTPCDEAELFSDRPIAYTLSCMAKYNNIVIVANMGGIERCETESNCPDDGLLHLNANVVFDQNGTLIARYYKERLFYEEGMDLPQKDQDPIFQTTFGKFATFICFDIIFEKISQIAQRPDIDAIMFSKMWMNQSPFYVSVPWLQAFAIGNNATIISANMQMPGWFASGSGMFMGRKGSVGHTLNPDGVSKLVVAKIIKNNRSLLPDFNITAIFKNGTQNWEDDSKNIPDVCSYSILGPAKNMNKDYRCVNENLSNYTLKKLLKANDRLQVCNHEMCCELEYTASSMNESYYIGVYNGTSSPFTRYFWWEENCFLGRCDDINGTACSVFPMASKTVFQKIHMKANFTSKNVFPSLVANKLKLVPVEDWTFDAYPGEASISFESTSGIPLLSATLKGRPYEKDPPYVR